MTKNKHSGMTFIELILYVALFIVFITSVVTVGIDALGTRSKVRVQQEVIHNVRLAKERISYEIRNASAINSVTATSISLANADTARNPTVISVSANRIMIGWGVSGACTAVSPCFLTSGDVIFSNVMFTNMSDGGNKSSSIKYALTGSHANPDGRSEWSYSQSVIGNVELRSK